MDVDQISLLINKQIPVLDFEGLQNLLSHCGSMIHEWALLCRNEVDLILWILARNVRYVNSNNDVGLLLFQTQQDQQDSGEIRLRPPRCGVWVLSGDECVRREVPAGVSRK